MFPLIKDRGTNDNWSDGKTANLKREHLQILTPDEECSIVGFIKNKNRCHQGSVSRKQVHDLIVDNLKIGDCSNLVRNCGGCKCVKLSQNAYCVMKGLPTNNFCQA